MKFPAVITAVIFLFCGWKNDIHTADKSQPDAIESGVEIDFSISAAQFPASWQKNEVSMFSLSDKEIQQSTLKIISAALKKYPTETIKKNIKKIYVLDSINIQGAYIAGTVYGDTIYMINTYKKSGWSDTLIEKRFHHEFSHILFNKFLQEFPAGTWRGVNAREYGSGGLNAARTNNDKLTDNKFDPDLMLCGFLYPYAQSAIEEDFASFAENIFCPTKEFLNAVDTHKKIKRKRELAINFYSKIDFKLNEDLFSKLILKE